MEVKKLKSSVRTRREPGPTAESPRTARRALRSSVLAALPLFVLPAQAQETNTAAADRPSALGRLAFVENLGQWSTPAAFVASLGRTVVRAERGGFVVDASPESKDEWVRMRFEFEGARAGVVPTGAVPLPGLRNYLRGNDPERWVHGARAFGQVVYRELYEGVDLRLRDADGMPEYDLLLAPHAELSQVVVRCEGVSGLEVDEQGGLRMHSAQGVLRQSPPLTWCVLPSGERELLSCEFAVLDEARFGFRMAEHDRDLPVVVDPGLEWATYLGGSADEWILGMDRNSLGQIVVAGTTFSIDFPTKLGPPDYPGLDAFVSILDASGSTLVASTLVGGALEDDALDVQVGASDEVFVVGTTNSADFPVTPDDAYLPTLQGMVVGPLDGFVVQLSSDLSEIDYASYFGGSDDDLVTGVHVTPPRVLTLVGTTDSGDFPITPATAVQPIYGGGDSDYWVCRLDLDQAPASQLLYGTYLGGSSQEGSMSIGGNPHAVPFLKTPDLHVDASGRVTLAGRTSSSNAPTTADGFQTNYDAPLDGYLARIDPSQSGAAGLVYATFIGGASGQSDSALTLAVDSAGVVTLGGRTHSPTFPTTPGAYQQQHENPGSGKTDAFVLRLDPGLSPPPSQLLYGTFLGGDGTDQVMELQLDAQGRVIAQGFAGSAGANFPTTCDAFQTQVGGNGDGYVAYLDPAGGGASDLLYSTLAGGSAFDRLNRGLLIVSETPTLKILASGASLSPDFPTTVGALQPSNNGLRDGVVLQLEIVGGAEVVRAGTPPNPTALLPGVTSGPVIGATWDPVIDHTTFAPGSLLDSLGLAFTPANVPLPGFGTLLCNFFATPLILYNAPAPGVPFSVFLPNDCGLLGATLCVQGVSYDGSAFLLTNALDATIGSF